MVTNGHVWLYIVMHGHVYSTDLFLMVKNLFLRRTNVDFEIVLGAKTQHTSKVDRCCPFFTKRKLGGPWNKKKKKEKLGKFS